MHVIVTNTLFKHLFKGVFFLLIIVYYSVFIAFGSVISSRVQVKHFGFRLCNNTVIITLQWGFQPEPIQEGQLKS